MSGTQAAAKGWARALACICLALSHTLISGICYYYLALMMKAAALHAVCHESMQRQQCWLANPLCHVVSPALSHRWVKQLLAAGVPCCDPLYLMDFVAQPWAPLTSHYKFGCTAPPELKVLEEDRGRDTRPVEHSMSF